MLPACFLSVGWLQSPPLALPRSLRVAPQQPRMQVKLDPYSTLGVQFGASAAEIKAAFRQRSLQYHPDLNRDEPEKAERKFMEIRQAPTAPRHSHTAHSESLPQRRSPALGVRCTGVRAADGRPDHVGTALREDGEEADGDANG